jgi:hypothetical protein
MLCGGPNSEMRSETEQAQREIEVKRSKNSRLPLMVVLKILRYQLAALVVASIIGGGPWMFNAERRDVHVEPTNVTLSARPDTAP